MTTHSCNCQECHAIERERLIDLIEGLFAKSVVPGYQTAVADAVALIKGESK